MFNKQELLVLKGMAVDRLDAVLTYLPKQHQESSKEAMTAKRDELIALVIKLENELSSYDYIPF